MTQLLLTNCSTFSSVTESSNILPREAGRDPLDITPLILRPVSISSLREGLYDKDFRTSAKPAAPQEFLLWLVMRGGTTLTHTKKND